MGRRRWMAGLAAVPLVALLAGCAAQGPSYTEAAAAFPSLKPGEGRVFFYRTSIFGAAIQPHVYLMGRPLGKSQPGGFFFVDLPAGPHNVTSTTETRSTYALDIEEGKTQYVVMNISMGIVAGRVEFGRVTESVGRAEVAQLKYTGLLPLAGGGGASLAAGTTPANNLGGNAATAATPRPASPQTPSGAQRQVTLDDLNGLLPTKP